MRPVVLSIADDVAAVCGRVADTVNGDLIRDPLGSRCGSSPADRVVEDRDADPVAGGAAALRGPDGDHGVGRRSERHAWSRAMTGERARIAERSVAGPDRVLEGVAVDVAGGPGDDGRRAGGGGDRPRRLRSRRRDRHGIAVGAVGSALRGEHAGARGRSEVALWGVDHRPGGYGWKPAARGGSTAVASFSPRGSGPGIRPGRRGPAASLTA